MKRTTRATALTIGLAVLAAWFGHLDRPVIAWFYVASALFALIVLYPLGEWLDQNEGSVP